jgi:predicted unusual protein kinase regulating ubiquinone biosynthesis (AarF/ABC1/UbiB family)
MVAAMVSTLYRLSVPDPSYRTGMIPYRQQYDPIAAQAYYARHVTVVLQRTLEMFRLSNRFLIHIAMDKYVWKREESTRPRRAQELLQLIQTLGPTAIKVGQALSVRPDLIPSEYATALSSLQDAVPPFDTTVARQLMRQELGVEKFDLLVLDAKSSKRPVARCVGIAIVVVVVVG